MHIIFKFFMQEDVGVPVQHPLHFANVPCDTICIMEEMLHQHPIICLQRRTLRRKWSIQCIVRKELTNLMENSFY